MADLHKLADKLLELADQISELFNEVEAGELSAEAAISTLPLTASVFNRH